MAVKPVRPTPTQPSNPFADHALLHGGYVTGMFDAPIARSRPDLSMALSRTGDGGAE
jgi:hypothetical protein